MLPGSIPAATGVAGSADASAGSSAGGGDGEVTGGEGTETQEVTGIGPAGGLGRSSAKLRPESGRQGSEDGGGSGAGSSAGGDGGEVTGTETQEVTGIGPAGGLARSSPKLLPEFGRQGSEEGGGVPGTCAETRAWSIHRLAARARQQRIAHRPPQRLCISSPGCRPEGQRQLVRENLPVGSGCHGRLVRP